MFEFLKRHGKNAESGTQDSDTFGLEGATSIFNLRELAGYSAEGGLTLPHRFLRSGALDTATAADCDFLKSYGVTRVVDLRGEAEVARGDGPLAEDPDISWINVPLFDYNMSDPCLMPRTGAAGYLAESYCTILANKPAVKEIFEFFAEAGADDCVLFHCAAGMDRTGVTSMLLLGLCGVDRDHIICDYSYSFGGAREVDKAVMSGKPPREDARAPRAQEPHQGDIGDLGPAHCRIWIGRYLSRLLRHHAGDETCRAGASRGLRGPQQSCSSRRFPVLHVAFSQTCFPYLILFG